MIDINLKRLFGAATLAAGIAVVGASASAATYASNLTCSVSDMTAAADECFGSIDANLNDSESVLNDNTFGTDVGMFGYTDWSFLAKEDTPGGLSGTDIGLDVSGSAQTGTWSVDAGALSSFERVMFVLKGSNTFSSYLYSPGNNAGDSGTWDTVSLINNGGNISDLSHLSIYTSGADNWECDPVTQVCGPPVGEVPVPAALPLLLSAFGITAVMSRRRRKAA